MNRRSLSSSVWLGLAIMVLGTGPVLGQTGEEDERRQQQVMERFLVLLEKTPRRGTALDRVYSYHVERGTIDAFLNGYREKTTKAPNNGNAWLLLGLFEAQRGRDAAAVEAFREAEKHLPQNPLPAYYLGQALVMVGQPDTAAEAFERAINRKPIRADLLEIFQALGKVHQRARRFDQALAVWGRLERLLPDDLRVQEQIAQALIDEGQFAEALPKLEGLAKKVKDPHRQVQFKMDAADLKVRLGRTTEALADFETLLGRLNPDAWLYREARRRLEDIFLRNDDMAGLASYYEKWIKKTPDDLDAIARLGHFLALQGRSAEARQWLDKAVKLAPSRRELRLALVEQLVKQGQMTEAAAQYEALVEREPNNPDTLREWGRLLLKDTSRSETERKANATKVWQKLADAKKDDAVSIAQVADLFRQAEMTEQAIVYYKKAIALAPESPQYREYLGEYYQTLKRPDDAIAVWSEIAAGPRRNAKTLARLSEILAGFDHLKPAVKAGAEAIVLEADDLALRIKQASFLQRDGRLADASTELDAAARLAESDDEKEEVLRLQIENYQAAGTLAGEIDRLKKALEAGNDATAPRWLRLARLWEADRRLPEAASAVKKVLAIDPKSVAAWSTAARLHESSGDLLAAADGYRKLVLLDRRSRSEYLTNIAKLEARLGRRAESIQAGRDLLASAPGNADNYQIFADLCFQLGAHEEGLETLRRSLRLNPSDAKVLRNLAEALARQLHIDESIEIYWRALAKTNEIDAKLDVISHLTELYLQRNQFDRLIGRLGREFNNTDQQRELAFCLAQAYSTAGDYGPARQELERLLASNPRDTQLLKQLSQLAETEGALDDASKYQKQLNDLAPSDEGISRLAQLYLKSGDMSEAEALWEKISAEDEDTHRVLQAVDSLLGNSKAAAALAITGRLLRSKPDDWEALYREGVALAELDRQDEAARRFQTMMALSMPDDTLSSIVKARRKGYPSSTPSSFWTLAFQARKYPLLYRSYAIYQIRQATGLEGRNYYGGVNSSWNPADYGEARMAALAWLYRLAEKKGRGEAYIKETREAATKAERDTRPRWNWFYFQMVREQGRGIYEAARDLARNAPQDLDAQWSMLHWLSDRTTRPGGYSYRPTGIGVVETTPPLPDDEIDLVLSAYRTLRLQRPDLVHPDLLASVDTELKRAQRERDRDQFYHEAVAAAADPGALGSVLQLAAERGDVDGAFTLFDKFDQTNPAHATIVFSYTFGGGDSLGRLMNARAQVKAHADIIRTLDHYVRVMQQRPPLTRRSRKSSLVSNRQTYYLWLGKEHQYTTIEFPTPNDHIDYDGILLLRNAFVLCRRDQKLPELFDHLRRLATEGTEIERIDAHLMLGYLHWWNEEHDLAIKEMAEAAQIRPSDPELKLTQAEVLEKNNEPSEALKLVNTVEPLDQRMMQRRELLALRLSVLTGNIDRARKAAERLFGLRLDVAIQSQLADQMDQLGMHELAEAILGRARRRAGNGTAALVSLMQQYQRQNRTDLAVQLALQILRRGGSTGFNPYSNWYATEDESARREAIGTLARAGRLKAMIERLEAQVKTSPQSVPLLQNLAEYYRADGKSTQAQATYQQILALRPDDAKIRFQIASQLLDDGETEAAIEHFRIVIKSDPSLFRFRSEEIFKAFRQAQQLDELIAILEQTDFRTLWHPYYATQVILDLFKEKEPKHREAALRLARKTLEAFPNDRRYVLGQIKEEEIWRLPEMLGYAQQAVIPSADEPLDSIWHGLDDVIDYGHDGHMIGVCTRLIEVASRRNALRPLLADIEAGVKHHPAWRGGQALRGLIHLRLGETDQALSILQPLLDDPKAPLESYTRGLLAQELEDYSASAPLALSLFEKASKEAEQDSREFFKTHPARQLIRLYDRLGRVADARELAVAFGHRKVTRYPNASTNQQIWFSNAMIVGEELSNLGLPVETAWFSQRMLEDQETIKSIQAEFASSGTTFPSEPDLIPMIEHRRNDAQGRFDRRALARSLRATFESSGHDVIAKVLTEFAEGADTPVPRLDLMLTVEPKAVDRARLQSPLEEMFAKADAPLRKAIAGDLARLREQEPDDLSLLILSSLVSLDQSTPSDVEPSLRALSTWLDRHPLEPIAPGQRATSRQQSAARPQVALWLVARRLIGEGDSQRLSERFATRAFESAGRLADSAWTLAILREQGQMALDRGNRTVAESKWRDLLNQILQPIRQAEAVKGVPVATPDRFRQAGELAQLAARNDMSKLALKALREVLLGGPPVQPLKVPKENQGNSSASSAQSEETRNAIARDVEQTFATLDPLWEKNAHPSSVYETLRDIVLTEARSGEIFLYERPLASEGIERPRSVGALLVKWGKQADQLDDLKRRVIARRKESRAEAPALVLLGRIGLETADAPLTREALTALSKLLTESAAQTTAEQACHVAVPALQSAETRSEALVVLEATAKALANGSGEEPMAGLSLLLARDHHAQGQKDETRKALRTYASALDRTLGSVKGDRALVVRKEHFVRLAREQLRLGLLSDALDTLGQFSEATTPQQGDPPLSEILASLCRQLAARPVRERFELLKGWSLPTAERKSFHLLAGFTPGEAPPEHFGISSLVGDTVISTADLLITAAREQGALDALSEEAEKAATTKLTNAEALVTLLQIARGKTNEVEPRLKTLLAKLPGKIPAEPETTPTPPAWPDVLVARACLRSRAPGLFSRGEALAKALLEHGQKVDSAPMVALLNRDLAQARVIQATGKPLAVGSGNALAHWTTVTGFSTIEDPAGAALWVEDKGALTHITGSAHDLLSLNDPLTGTFTLSARVSAKENEQGHLAYGGLVFEPLRPKETKSPFDTFLYTRLDVHLESLREGRIWPLNGQEPFLRACRSLGSNEDAQLTIEVSPKRVRSLVNGHVFFEDNAPSPASPWLALYAASGRIAKFQDITIQGSPVIPRQVVLSSDNHLAGWVPGIQGETLPRWQNPANRAATDTIGIADGPDWSCQDGEIQGKRFALSSRSGTVPSLLAYHRPLQEGETVRFEFFAEPGKIEVHPVLGRLAFLLEPEGIRLRWLSHRPDPDWTGLAVDNAVAIPNARRGPEKLPLKPAAWNQAALKVVDNRVTLELNGILVLELPLTPGQSRRFGLYHDKNQTTARVRQVVLTGPWHETITPEILAGLMAPREGSPTLDPKVREALLGNRSSNPKAEESTNFTAPKVEHWHPTTSGQTHAMIFDQPLIGDFILSAELALAQPRLELGYGGVRFGVTSDRKHYRWTNGERSGEGLLEPAIPPDQTCYNAQLAIRGSEATFSIAGRQVHVEHLADRPDPWLLFRGLPTQGESVRQVKISGRPSVPRRLELSPLAGLGAWAIDPEPEDLGEDSPRIWSWRGEELVGINFRDIPGSRQESRLVYHRPLLEDGEIAYEFFVEEGNRMVHPSLGNVGFLLEPEGITAVDFATSSKPSVGPQAPRERRLTDKPLTLKRNDWNQLRLSLAKGTLTLRLNGDVVLEQPWSADASRQFGLFHFLDETEARVRQISYQGAWSETVPEP